MKLAFKILALTFAISYFSAVAARAQEMPVYDGVYVMVDGAWITMEPVHFGDLGIGAATAVESPAAPANYGIDFGWHKFRALPPEAIRDATVLSTTDYSSSGPKIMVFVRGRDLSLTRVHMVLDAQDLSRSVIELPDQGIGNFSTFRSDGAGRLSNSDYRYVDSGWGWNTDMFRVRTIDQFSSEYELQNYFWFRSSWGSPISKTDQHLPVYGFLIKTSDGRAHLFTLKHYCANFKRVAAGQPQQCE